MVDGGVAARARESGGSGSDGGGTGADPLASALEAPSVADAMGTDVDDVADGDSLTPPDVAVDRHVDPGTESVLDDPSEVSALVGADAQLSVRTPASAVPSPEPNPEALRHIRAVSKRQAEDIRDDASEKAVQIVRTEVRRILGLDGKPDFEAESVSHVMGLARDGERVDPELEKELRAELDALGVNLDGVRLRYESMSKDDRRQLTTFEVQQAFLRVVERVDKLATQASVSLGHRIRMFDGEARDQLKLVAGLRVLLETEQAKVEELVVGFRNSIQEETEGFEQVVVEQKKVLTDKLQSLQGAFDGVNGHLKSCQMAATALEDQVATVGSTVTQAEQEAQRVISELQRVAGSGFAVRRLALIGGVAGSAVGGFFAFVVLLLLWAVTAG